MTESQENYVNGMHKWFKSYVLSIKAADEEAAHFDRLIEFNTKKKEFQLDIKSDYIKQFNLAAIDYNNWIDDNELTESTEKIDLI